MGTRVQSLLKFHSNHDFWWSSRRIQNSNISKTEVTDGKRQWQIFKRERSDEYRTRVQSVLKFHSKRSSCMVRIVTRQRWRLIRSKFATEHGNSTRYMEKNIYIQIGKFHQVYWIYTYLELDVTAVRNRSTKTYRSTTCIWTNAVRLCKGSGFYSERSVVWTKGRYDCQHTTSNKKKFHSYRTSVGQKNGPRNTWFMEEYRQCTTSTNNWQVGREGKLLESTTVDKIQGPRR